MANAPAAEQSRLVRRLYSYRVLSRLYFHLSILFVLLVTEGQHLVAVEAELAVYGLAIVSAGPLVDAIGPFRAGRRILVGGEVLKAAGLALLASDPRSVPVAVAAQTLNGFGFGLTSMTDPVVVANALRGNPQAIGRFQASSQSLMFLSTLVAGVTGALLFEWDRTAPLWFSCATTLAAAFAVSRLPFRPSDVSSPARVRGAVDRLGRRQLRIGAYYVLTRGFMLAAFVGVLPFLLYSSEHVGVVALSAALAAFTVAAFITAKASQRLLQVAGPTALLVGSPVLVACSFLCFAFTRNVALTVLAMTVMGAGSGAVRPVTMRLLGEIGTSDPQLPGLAVVAKRMESAFGIVNAVVIVSTGVLVRATSFEAGMLILTAAFVVALLGAVASTIAKPGTTVDVEPSSIDDGSSHGGEPGVLVFAKPPSPTAPAGSSPTGALDRGAGLMSRAEPA